MKNHQKSLEIIVNLLVEETNNHNLTAIKNADEVWEKHIQDSLEVVGVMNQLVTSEARILDMGTGAGFPGLIVALMGDFSQVVLLDSVRKKIDFCVKCILAANLKNCLAIAERIEDHARKNRDKYDLLVARALADTKVLLEYASPLTKQGGYLLAMKKQDLQEDWKDFEYYLEATGFEKIREHKYLLNDQARQILVFCKNKLPKIVLPRRNGLATKRLLRREKE